MEGEREPGGEGASMASSRDVAFRESVPPPQLQNPPQHSRGPSMGALEQAQSHHGHAYRPPPEAELHVLTRLEQQVSFNYGMIQGHRQDIIRLGDTVGRLSHEMNSVLQMMEEMRAEMRARQTSQAVERSRYDPGDLEILTTQIANVTTKANEIDNVRVQVDLLKRKIKRMEEQNGTSSSEPRPRTSSSREALDDRPSQPPQLPPGHLPSHSRPGMVLSPDESRQATYHGARPLDPQATNIHPPNHQRRATPNDQHPQAVHVQSGLRGVGGKHAPELAGWLAPNWRSAEGYAPPGAPLPPPGHTLRSNELKPESQPSGWAAVNINQGPKRPLEDRPSVQDDSRPGSPKRPRLAALVPRSSHGDEPYPPAQSPYARVAHPEPLPPTQNMRRISSGDPHAQQQHPLQYMPAQPSSAVNSYRFITSTGHDNNEEIWRGIGHDRSSDNPPTQTAPPEGGRGRGRGSRGGRGGSRRGGRGRGSRGGAGAPSVEQQYPQTFHLQEVPSHDPPQLQPAQEYREQTWHQPSQVSPNGQRPSIHPYSPTDIPRGVPLEVLPPGAVPPPNHPSAQPIHDPQEAPETPVNSGDAFAASQALLDNSGNKKTRTKPIRNAEGILIRKDGRPDMRSVSSANNLRKVHAKKEAERAENEGRTPTSGQSGNGGDGTSLSDEEGDEHEHDQEGQDDDSRSGTPLDRDAEVSVQRHRALMATMFPYGGAESAAAPKGVAEAWFPRAPETGAAEVKREDVESNVEGRWRGAEVVQTRETEQGGAAPQVGEALPPISTIQDDRPREDAGGDEVQQRTTAPAEESRQEVIAEQAVVTHESAEQPA